MGLVFVGLFFGELLASLKVGLLIGFGWSVVWIIASAAVGGLLIRLSPYALMHTFNTINLSGFDVRNAQNAALSYLFAAILLLIPGVLTDGLGLVMLLYTIYLRLFATMRPNNSHTHKGDDDVIDVEIIDEFDGRNADAERRKL
jgi:UPF0716 family protein affecting phage T7 exclusion